MHPFSQSLYAGFTGLYQSSSRWCFPLIFFVLRLSEKETERAEGELGTMDGLSPRATHNCCQVWTATQQPIHYSVLCTVADIAALLCSMSSYCEVGSRINKTTANMSAPHALCRHCLDLSFRIMYST